MFRAITGQTYGPDRLPRLKIRVGSMAIFHCRLCASGKAAMAPNGPAGLTHTFYVRASDKLRPDRPVFAEVMPLIAAADAASISSPAQVGRRSNHITGRFVTLPSTN